MRRNFRSGECILVSLGCGCLALCGLAVVGVIALYVLWGSNYSTDPATVEAAAQQVLPGIKAMPGCHKAKLVKVGRVITYITLGDVAAGDTYSVYIEATPNSNDPAKAWKEHAPTPTGGEIDTQLVDLRIGGRPETVLRKLDKGSESFRVGFMGHGRALDMQIATRPHPLDRDGLQAFLDGLNLGGYASYASTQGDRVHYYQLKAKKVPPVNGIALGVSRAQVENLLGQAPQSVPAPDGGTRLLYQAGQLWVDLDNQNLVREVNGQKAPGIEFATKVDSLAGQVEAITFLDQAERPGCFLRTEDGQVTRIISRRS